MTGEAVKALALELSREEMRGNRLCERSREAGEKARKDFIGWIDRKEYALKTVGPGELREYHKELCQRKSKRTGEPLAPQTINNLFHSAAALFSLLYREGVIANNPARDLNLSVPETKGIRRRPLTRREINLFLERIDAGTSQGLKDRTLFEVIYSSGLRVSEAAELKVRDIDFQRREMVVHGKGSRDRMVPFSKMAK
jgi:integrase/recombinase XerD